ncbi:hypothetical protein PAE9249_04621 [Paenibacillus sp. CECT 9249]|nr:hypothetical protein PAE9249_04621 [Paenibacillus sp. CECT 9249]
MNQTTLRQFERISGMMDTLESLQLCIPSTRFDRLLQQSLR